MKKSNHKSVYVPATAQARVGTVATSKFRSFFRINSSSVQRDIQVQVLSLAGGEKEELAHQIGAELKRAQAETYASALIMR